MRIIGGDMGGRHIKAPQGAVTRPTAERVREAIFNILGPPSADARALDIFAGAGTLGLEALSRGAAKVVFLESSRPALRCLRQNIAALGVAESSELHSGDALRALKRISTTFVWIFVDPPYKTDLASQVLEILGRGELLSDDAVVVVEHDRRNEPHSRQGCLVRTDLRRYGDTEVSFYRRGAQ